MTDSVLGARRAARRVRRKPPTARHIRFGRRSLILAAVLLALVVTTFVGGRLVQNLGAQMSARPLEQALASELQLGHAPAEVAEFYRARNYQPLWAQVSGVWPFTAKASLRPEARVMLARADGPERARLAAAVATAQGGDPAALARAELALSVALGDYVRGRWRTAPGAQLAFLDPVLATPSDTRQILDHAAQAPLARVLAVLDEVNPIYHALRDDLAAYRAEWSRLPQIQVPAGPAIGFGDSGERARLLRLRLGLPAAGADFDETVEQAVRHFQTAHGLPPTGEADAATLGALNAGAAHYEQLITANLERARALPPPRANRFILVNVAAGQLWLYEDGQAKSSMRVVVGRRDDPTPMMAGVIRYLVLKPYWDIPVDLVRDSLAPKMLKFGPGHFTASHMQALSDWGDQPFELDPRTIDWQAVAAGRTELRVRQRPGGDNMMGQVKFMMPNELGIYLHDTPDKGAFQSSERLLSAGCVRLERAADLVSWLLGDRSPDIGTAGLDQHVDLDQPTPVYITYLTAAPGASGVTFYPDVYGRDPALLATLGARKTPALKAAA